MKQANHTKKVPAKKKKPATAKRARRAAPRKKRMAPRPVAQLKGPEPMAKRQTDIDVAWFKARMKEHGLSQTATASRLGMHKTSFGRIWTGDREVSAREVAALADVLRASTAEIIRRLGFETSTGVPVTGRVLADGQVSSVVVDRGADTKLGDYPVGAQALVVEAAEGPLAAWDGALLVYLPSDAKAPPPDTIGRLCVAEDAAAAMPLVGVLEAATGSRGNQITVFGTGERRKVHRLVRASPVLGLHMRT